MGRLLKGELFYDITKFYAWFCELFRIQGELLVRKRWVTPLWYKISKKMYATVAGNDMILTYKSELLLLI